MVLMELNWHPSRRQLRVFGSAATVVSLALALGLWTKPAQVAALAAATAAAACAVVALIAPAALRPLYLALHLVTYPIGWATSFALLAIFYYAVVTPVGLALRLAGRDSMTRGFDRRATSYWTARSATRALKQYFRMF